MVLYFPKRPIQQDVFLLIMSFPFLDLEPQVEDTLGILDNLVSTKLALSVQTVDERDGNLSDGAAHGLGTHHQLHLETVSLALSASNSLLERSTLVQTEA